MMILLSLMVVVLLVLVTWQRVTLRNRKKEIIYISEKLEQIMVDQTSEKILLQTDKHSIKSLVNTVNQLLSMKEKVSADFKNKELSMNKMLSNISHDLKTPLTVVLGYLEMIRKPEIDKVNPQEKERMLAKVQEKVEVLLSLIHKFFDLAKLEAGDQDYPLTRIEINEICRSNILDFFKIIEAQELEVSIEIPETPVYAFANKEALDRVLSNLISNAIQYGSGGGIIGLRILTDEQCIEIEVWDRGQGIEEAYKEQVFERMYTMEDSRNPSFQGSGLGLTITKQLVENLGGKLKLRSLPFQETTFSIQLKRLK
ncbi:sensor histidine kinase [Salibacterium aidingense]|uniref:sensor histidine kinase n=1 Tax=Salibacterium aidingense TaxID=384933 RepID=UPI003BEA023A